ncbi:Acetylornithine deacetylase [Aquicella siphonis]|uniref:Acetylornithine deacetylase n=1 Tax=Aquicella siphonis TaxID=254247 RepID=A0A5E4PJC5_9COXI|nr:acetylornithine deacetylase [Aquicella siphonis]VVC76537.1 Acetylornithine deacetylase [Aquicella siphonis]
MSTLEWLKRLIEFDTTSRNSNLELISCAQAWFERHHLQTRITRDPRQAKANLFATLPAQNGSVDGGVILSGHTDVVPVDGQQWDTPPFTAVLRDDKVYGRGACDMKGFLAVLLALVPEFVRLKLSHPVHFAFSYDEEVGCLGASVMITDLQHAGIKPAACIVGEPTSMRPVVAHKGVQVFRCRIRGRAAHSSLTPQGCNAIEYAAKLICHIRSLADEFNREGPFDRHFDVPFTTVSTNMIQGGHARNIIPEQCEFFFEFRHLPGIQPRSVIDRITAYVQEAIQPQMQKEYGDAGIEIDAVAAVPGFEAGDDAVVSWLARAAGLENEIRKVAYATEAGLFQQAHIPVLVCGPGSIEQAHRANEFVTLDQLALCEDFLRKVVKTF